MSLFKRFLKPIKSRPNLNASMGIKKKSIYEYIYKIEGNDELRKEYGMIRKGVKR